MQRSRVGNGGLVHSTRTENAMSSLIEADPLALPVAARDSWRTWVMTGTRRAPIDRRRIRGAHKGLKKMLVEGMSNGGDRPQYWNNFSGVLANLRFKRSNPSSTNPKS